jgi:hypothetical protein
MSKRTEKGSNKKWVDRIDIISAHAGSKHVSQTSFPVNTFGDVIARQVVALPRFVFCIVFCIVFWVLTHDCSISLFSEQLHECLGICPTQPQSYSVWSLSITFSSGTRLDDVLGESLNIKSLRGIDSFMHPL